MKTSSARREIVWNHIKRDRCYVTGDCASVSLPRRHHWKHGIVELMCHLIWNRIPSFERQAFGTTHWTWCEMHWCRGALLSRARVVGDVRIRRFRNRMSGLLEIKIPYDSSKFCIQQRYFQGSRGDGDGPSNARFQSTVKRQAMNIIFPISIARSGIPSRHRQRCKESCIHRWIALKHQASTKHWHELTFEKYTYGVIGGMLLLAGNNRFSLQLIFNRVAQTVYRWLWMVNVGLHVAQSSNQEW